MPSPENKFLQSVLKPIFKDVGYKKKGPTWHFIDDDFVRVFNLQGSQWSTSFYLNLGIYVRSLGPLERPNEYDCHLRERVDAIVPDSIDVHDIIDFTNDIEESVRIEQLTKITKEYVLPWLESKSNFEGFRKYFFDEKNHGLPMMRGVKEFLESNKLSTANKAVDSTRTSCAGPRVSL